MKSIVKDLCNYTDDFETIDEEFIIDTINKIVSKYKGLNEYLNDILFTSHSNRGSEFLLGRPLTNFDSKMMNMSFDTDSIIDYNDRKYLKLLDKLNTKEKVFLDNLSIFEEVLHQIENLMQQANLKRNTNTIENKLVDISKYHDLEHITYFNNTLDSYLNYMIQFDKEYQNSAVFYNLNPAERLANIKSSKIINQIANEVLNKHSNLLKDIFHYNYLKKSLYGYYPNLYSPLKSYIEFKKSLTIENDIAIYSYNENNLLQEQSSLPLNKRILYGMNLDKKELESEYSKLKETKTYQLLKK